MAATKIIIATVPKSDKLRTFNMLTTSRKTEILQQMAAAKDLQLGLQPQPGPVKHTLQDSENPAPRKRQRLTHLTPEEKMMRRKLKNRVAAQTARDRKKAQMDGMENSMSVIEARNKQLQLENSLLRKQNQSLLEENQALKARLQGKTDSEAPSVVVLDHGYCMDASSTPTSTTTTLIPAKKQSQTPTGMPRLTVKKEEGVESPESAALNAPPQQELARLFLTFLSTMLTWSLMTSFLACWASSPRLPTAEPFSFLEAKLPSEEPLCLVKRKGIQQAGHRDRPAWWGPQQQSWNPSKN